MSGQSRGDTGPEREEVLGDRPLVVVDRHSTALRTGYTGPAAAGALRPALAIGCYAAWDPALADLVVAAEDRTRVRSVAERHGWPRRVRHEAARHLVKLERPPVVVTGCADARLEELAGPGCTLAAIDPGVRATLEAKPLLDDLLRAAGVPAVARVPAVHVDRLPSPAELRRAVGAERVVVQAGGPGAGSGTVIVAGEGDMGRAARLLGPYRVAAYVAGWPVAITVLSVPDGTGGVGVYADRPAHLTTGVTEPSVGPLGAAGADWSRPWPAPAAALLIECAERVALWAWRRYGAAGMFGVEGILTPDERVHLTALRWRRQRRDEVQAVNQQAAGLPPFVLGHLAVMLGRPVGWLGEPGEFNQLTLLRATRPGGPFAVRLRLAEGPPVRVAAGQGSGVYRLDRDGRARWVRRAAHPSQAPADEGEFLLADLPGPDVACHPGADLGTLEGVTGGGVPPFHGPASVSPFTRKVLAAVGGLLVPWERP
ncbi:hypothetical protein MF672_037150 [Actinomadura sp. ATCC 31491]|uniref:ATP-grasp domain-containing protein n=1 Tax=Actinomadura luzonensis TaxID=2805427 RepID=A0ABT0G496_9ACTN|nr:hypothetical protein [Actinomadura luzonensis]MCK2219385.1 hypothetical protein [Actinomadura luzonensis]